MKSKYHDLIKHIPKLEDHGRLYMYYGMPYSHDCHVYGHDENENLIVSHECHLSSTMDRGCSETTAAKTMTVSAWTLTKHGCE